MPLPIPPLDDRKFQDIVDEVKRRIPEHCPEWTNHNVSDPGVALIELFAWMSEMVLYRVNQVPDRLYLHFLNMVGIEPYPSGVARTNLTFLLAAELDHPVEVPLGFEVTTVLDASAGRADPVVFSTTETLRVSPPKLVDAKTSSIRDGDVQDVWDEVRLADTKRAAVFRSLPMTPGDAFYLGFSDSLAGMLVRITLDAEAQGIGVDPTAPPVVWQVGDGKDSWIDATLVSDSTGGLNKPGAIELMVPLAHRPSTVGNESLFWLRAVLLDPVAGTPTYKRTPQLRNVRVAALGGTVKAEHAQHAGPEELGRGDGKPGQLFQVRHEQVVARRDDEKVVVLHGDQVQDDWHEVSDFSESGPFDRHYTWDGASGEIRFGPLVRLPDGNTRQHGAAPADGAHVTVSGYRYGGGSRGNVKAGALSLMRSTLPFVSRVSNLTDAVGGVDGETLDEARTRAPLTLRTGQRAVTPSDYERLVRAVPGVARVRCVAARRGDATARLLVVPALPSNGEAHHVDRFSLTDDLARRVSATLEEHRVVGTAVEVTTPYFQGVSVAALVHAMPGRNPATVRLNAIEALTTFINPLTGGPDRQGWPYDTDLNAGIITQMLESVDGVGRVEEALLFSYDLRNGRRLDAASDVVRLRPHTLFLSASHRVVVR